MSEYQYYEFLAVDRPLGPQEMADLRALTTRARITPTCLINTYHWGDFRGDPRALMGRYFDAFLYLANWGTRQVMVRLPERLLDLDTALAYCVGGAADASADGEHVICEFTSREEEEYWETDGEGELASIIPARAELASGDLRLLYLGWLLAAQVGELDDDEVEPPVPPGLGSLSAPLCAFVDFLRIDKDLVAVAAEASARPQTDERAGPELAAWVRNLPLADKDALLLRVARGEDAQVRTELLRRFRGEQEPEAAGTGDRTVGELLHGAALRTVERERLAAQQRAAERARRERAAALAREKRLDALAVQGEHAWQRVSALVDTKKPREYDTAVELLADLRALSEREGDTVRFDRRLADLRQQHQRKPSLLQRLDRAGLQAPARQ